MIKKIDHVVITTENIEAAIAFYAKLGFKARGETERNAVFAGDFRINFHQKGKELSPHAQCVQIGSADLCFEVQGTIEEFQTHLEDAGILLLSKAVERNGAFGGMKSIYLRDLDGNLLEFSSYE